VDKDLHWGPRWSGSSAAKLPAYTQAFRFSDLQYEPGVPVVGSTGPKPGVAIDNASKQDFYWRGHLDSYGDEWHVIAVADDDQLMLPSTADKERWAGDGKLIHFVVNPKTPCLTLTPVSTGQFYTTPAKSYFVPKIHEQITYLSGQINIEFNDLSGRDVVLRINGGAWSTNREPFTLSSDVFSNGTNRVDYWSASPQYVKSRVFVKNPDFPSKGERHGNLLWKDEAGFNTVKSRIQRNPYKWLFDQYRTSSLYNKQDDWDRFGRTGSRKETEGALGNAFVARMLGNDARWGTRAKSYAQYAKEMVLDHRTIDPVGHEINHSGEAIPTREMIYRGYYDVNSLYDALFAYDLLIATYRSDQHSGGITPVEDYYIRDTFGDWVVEQLTKDGGWTEQHLYSLNSGGMWDTARKTGSLSVMIAMPTYSTHYYGTSGLD
jgi:hypothetical protein